MNPLLAAWLHDLDPFALRLPDVGFLPEGIRWYGLSYLIGFAIGYLLLRRVTRVGVSSLAPDKVADMVVTFAIGVVVGGRLGYVLFYKPELLWTVFDSPPWWGVLAINEGGMASHGGMIGGAIAAFWFAHRNGHSLLHLLDLFAFGAPLGLGIGRVANFINGELIGRAAPADFPLAVKFPQEMWDALDRDAVRAPWSIDQLNVLADRLGMADTLVGASYREYQRFIATVINQIQAGNQQVQAIVEPMLTPRHPSQLYAAALEGLAVFLVLLWVWRRPRKPGLVGAWFCIAYAIARIFNEFFRRPDMHLQDAEFALLGITRGQWLSVLLLAVGVWGIWFSTRRPVNEMGAWRRGPWTRNDTPPQ